MKDYHFEEFADEYDATFDKIKYNPPSIRMHLLMILATFICSLVILLIMKKEPFLTTRKSSQWFSYWHPKNSRVNCVKAKEVQ